MVPDAINLASVRRVLVVKLRHHRDVLLSSPAFSVLKNRASHALDDAYIESGAVAAGSVVSGRVGARAVWGGNPCRFIRARGRDS